MTLELLAKVAGLEKMSNHPQDHQLENLVLTCGCGAKDWVPILPVGLAF